jgi:cobalamin biosynthetic protein CobC
MGTPRDHGGGIDAAVVRYGGARADWLDLSTGINRVPYPLPDFSAADWTDLPDRAAFDRLDAAARRFWAVPEGAEVLPAPGASALIARLPALAAHGTVRIDSRTYNEHEAAYREAGWTVLHEGTAPVRTVVHPNNPDGTLWDGRDAPDGTGTLLVIDESFCDATPDASLIARAAEPGVIVLKSFGKFWGLAGLRLGFAIGHPDTLAPLARLTGPWAVSGPALRVGALALSDAPWADATRKRLAMDAARADALMAAAGASVAGGTFLFRLYEVDDARAWQDRLARHRILTRIFPYSGSWLRLGLPGSDGEWQRLAAALDVQP